MFHWVPIKCHMITIWRLPLIIINKPWFLHPGLTLTGISRRTITGLDYHSNITGFIGLLSSFFKAGISPDDHLSELVEAKI